MCGILFFILIYIQCLIFSYWCYRGVMFENIKRSATCFGSLFIRRYVNCVITGMVRLNLPRRETSFYHTNISDR